MKINTCVSVGQDMYPNYAAAVADKAQVCQHFSECPSDGRLIRLYGTPMGSGGEIACLPYL